MKNYTTITILLIIIFSTTLLNAQTKKTNTTASQKPAKPEIDKLYEKYKDSDNITLYTPHGDINGNVQIEFNNNEKPVSVTINGNSTNKAAIAEFISNTIKMKLKQGYKATKTPFFWGSLPYTEIVEQCLGWGFKEENSFQLLMRKGNMYFRVDAGCCAKDSKGYMGDGYTWEIVTGDSKRQGGDKATNFEF